MEVNLSFIKKKMFLYIFLQNVNSYTLNEYNNFWVPLIDVSFISFSYSMQLATFKTEVYLLHSLCLPAIDTLSSINMLLNQILARE